MAKSQMNQSMRDMIAQSLSARDKERKEAQKPEPQRYQPGLVLGKVRQPSQVLKKELRPRMEPTEIHLVATTIKAGDHVEIQFKEQDIFDVTYLLGMHKAKVIAVDDDGSLGSDYVIMLAVFESREWGMPTNRIFRFTANKWSLQWFQDRIQRRIEAIRILN